MNAFRVAKMLVHCARLVKDPNRLEEVFKLANDIEHPEVIVPIVEAFGATPEGKRALHERPRIGRIDMTALRAMPEGTLGRAFASFLDANGLDPAALPMLDDRGSDFAYVRAHLYETHDVWHTLTGFGADVAGELGLQAFYLAQFPARLAALILALGMVNTFLYAFNDRDARMQAIARGWLMGRRARPILGVDWKTLWNMPLAEVRARFGIDVAGIEATFAPETVRVAA